MYKDLNRSFSLLIEKKRQEINARVSLKCRINKLNNEFSSFCCLKQQNDENSKNS